MFLIMKMSLYYTETREMKEKKESKVFLINFSFHSFLKGLLRRVVTILGSCFNEAMERRC